MAFNKKGISPVVATALLLVVAVVAVVGFQTWFNTYQSGLNTKVEQESKAGASLTVERLEVSANGTVYVKNTATSPVQIDSWKVTRSGTTYCSGTVPQNASSQAVTTFTGTAACGTALTTGTDYDVVLVAANGVFSATVLAR